MACAAAHFRNLIHAVPAARQDALHQRHIGQDPDAVIPACGRRLVLNGAEQQVVAELIRSACPRLHPRVQVARTEIGHPDGADFALVLQTHQLRGSVLETCGIAGPVNLVQIDGGGPQPFEARLAGRAQRLGPQTMLRRNLAGDEHVVAAGPQRLAERLLRPAPGVALRGIKQRDPRIDGRLHGRLGVRIGAFAPVCRIGQLPRAKGIDRHGQFAVSQGAVFHRQILRDYGLIASVSQIGRRAFQ